jgi:hypothetical protein
MPVLVIDLILDDCGPANWSMPRAFFSGTLNLAPNGAKKRKRFSEEQIAFVLRQAESGTMIEDICCKEIRPRNRQKCCSIWRRLRSRQFERLAGHGSLTRDPSSSGNFASNSASEIPNAPAVALFGAPNAVIARTKRRSASPKFEAPHFSAASASLSASTRGVIAFRFRPEPGLAPPRPIPLNCVISPLGGPSSLFDCNRSDIRHRRTARVCSLP